MTQKGSSRLTFQYDYLGRRVEKCVYSGDTLSSRTLFVYDGFKCVEELDALNGNAVQKRHTWQPFDAGLDGLLATTDDNGTAYFLHDANKNVMQKTREEGTTEETYAYAPFGENVGTASANVGFSSEAFDAPTNLNYYNYRYYVPDIGRWNRRDPVEEKGGVNLFTMCKNNVVKYNDSFGLSCCNGVKYNIFTQCCCHGEILRNRKIATGIKICKAIMGNDRYGEDNKSILGFSHYWVEVDQTSVHFSGDGAVGNEIFYRKRPGIVEVKDNYETEGDGYAKLTESPFFKGRGKVCQWIYLNPCSVNISQVKQSIVENVKRLKLNPPGYNVFIYNCEDFANEIVNRNFQSLGNVSVLHDILRWLKPDGIHCLPRHLWDGFHLPFCPGICHPCIPKHIAYF